MIPLSKHFVSSEYVSLTNKHREDDGNKRRRKKLQWAKKIVTREKLTRAINLWAIIDTSFTDLCKNIFFFPSDKLWRPREASLNFTCQLKISCYANKVFAFICLRQNMIKADKMVWVCFDKTFNNILFFSPKIILWQESILTQSSGGLLLLLECSAIASL